MHERFFRGFTIPELMIVIIIIGILATLGLVSYKGAQERAHDTAVKSDLTNLATRMHSFYISKNHYPYTDAEMMSITGMKLHRASYDTSGHGVQYCATNGTGANMLIVAKSRTGKVFSIGNEEPMQAGAYPDTQCSSVAPGSYIMRIHNAYTGEWLGNF